MFDIIHNSTGKVFNRGEKIAKQEGSIVGRSFMPGRQRCDISANVRSSSGLADYFHTYIATDPQLQSIVDYECSCPAARNYNGMCKHCVALALAFKADPLTFQGFTGHARVHTSYSLKNFITKSPKRSDLRIEAGSAHLEPTLTYEFGDWELQLSISAMGVSYVMSDIFDFATAFRNGFFYSYGKRLAFVHSPEVFDGPSVELAALVLDKVCSGAIPKRGLSLNDSDVAKILDICHGPVHDPVRGAPHESLPGEQGDGGETPSAAPMRLRFIDKVIDERVYGLKIIDEDPKFALRIVETDENAFELVRDHRMIVVANADRAYIFLDGAAYRCSPRFSACANFLKEVYCSPRDDAILLSIEDAPEFCANVMPSLERALSISIPEALEELRPREARFSFYLDKTGRGKSQRIECRVTVDYGQGERDLLAPSKAGAKEPAPSAGYHDEEIEGAACSLVFEYFDMELAIPLSDEKAAGEFLYEGLPRFRQMGAILTTAAFDRMINTKRANLQIGLSLSGNLIDLDIHSTDLEPEELSKLLRAYRQKKKFHRLGDGSIASLEDMGLSELDRMAQDLGIDPKQIAEGSVELPTYAAFLLDREYSIAHRDKSFEDYIDRFDDEALYDVEPPTGLHARLRPYQLEGARWFWKLSTIGFGGILADEMGLGKTLQAICYLILLRNGHGSHEGKADESQPAESDEGIETSDAKPLPSLVVCPASLVYNWQKEMAKFAPSLKCSVIDGPKGERRLKRQQPGADLMVASYDAVRMDAEQFSEMEFSCVILDEAQYIKNHATKTTRAVKRLQARHRFALTGTPIENRLSEIWSIFDFLMPGFLGTYSQFRTRFETDILGGDDEVAAHFQALVSPFVLRRLKADVLKELPEKQESVVFVPLEGEQRKLYDALEQNIRQDLLEQRKSGKAQHSGKAPKGGIAKVEVLAELMRLREVALEPSLVYENYECGSSKTSAVLELIREAMRSGKKSLVFSQFTNYLDILKKRLDDEGVAYYTITGSTSKKTRLDLVNDFNDNNVPVFLISLKAGGTGLNLIGASVVIHADPWWNAATTEQATDRAHRIGQTEMVSVYKVIAKNTIEERILELQEKKSDLAYSVVSKNSLASLSSLTREELESLLFD